MQSKFKPDISSERQRRWHAKVTSGCITCRRRRVKCDEQRPICKSCSRLKFTCHGNGYGLDASTTNENKNRNKSVVSDFHVVTPESYERRRQSDTSSSDRGSISSSSSHEAQHTTLQQGRSSCGLAATTVVTATRLPAISSILGIGGFDPFNTICVTDASTTDHRLLDHVFNQWAAFIAVDKAQNGRNITSEVMSYALTHPVAYYTTIYAGASHHAYYANGASDVPQQDLTRLSLKNRAIQAMVQALQKKDCEITDEIVISMVTLAAHGSGESVAREVPTKIQSRKKVATLRAGELDYYGALDPEVEHVQVLYQLIRRRGGLHMITSRAVLMAATFFDIWYSWKTLSCPGLPMLQPLQETLKLRTWHMDSKGDQLYRRLTSSLTPVVVALNLPERAAMLCIIESFRIQTTDLHQVRRTPKVESVLSAPDTSVLTWIGLMSMHTLLSLPDYTTQALEPSSEHSDESSLLVYELWRVSSLMFAQIWLIPIINKRKNMARRLLTKMWPLLCASISPLHDGSALSLQHPDFFLWAVILSLVCAYEDLDSSGEMTSMQQMSRFIVHTQIEPVVESWPKIVDVLERFVWAGFDCDLTGQEAWQQACSLLSMSRQASPSSPMVIRTRQPEPHQDQVHIG